LVVVVVVVDKPIWAKGAVGVHGAALGAVIGCRRVRGGRATRFSANKVRTIPAGVDLRTNCLPAVLGNQF